MRHRLKTESVYTGTCGDHYCGGHYDTYAVCSVCDYKTRMRHDDRLSELELKHRVEILEKMNGITEKV